MSKGPNTERAFYIEEELMLEMKSMFGTAQNAYRWLRLSSIGVPLYSYQRMTRGEPTRQTEILDVETQWSLFKEKHNFTDSDFQNLTDLNDIRNESRNMRRSGPRVPAAQRGTTFVQEEFVEPDGEFFDF